MPPADVNAAAEKTKTKTGPAWAHGSSPAKNAGLASIMAQQREESLAAQRVRERRRRDEEDDRALRRALAASLAEEGGGGGSGSGAEEEDADLALALRLSMLGDAAHAEPPASAASAATEPCPSPPPAAAAAAAGGAAAAALPADELASIRRALEEADAAEARRSYRLALALQSEEEAGMKPAAAASQGNVRTLTRAQYVYQQHGGAAAGGMVRHDDDGDDGDDGFAAAGYRINASVAGGSAWQRIGPDAIVGPDDQVRTKHDPDLQGLANAHRLGVDDGGGHGGGGRRIRVGNRAYNAYRQDLQKKTKKGVATSGQGRAATDADKTKQGALDAAARRHVAKAINHGLFDVLHGCVKEGKEALIYHGEKRRGGAGAAEGEDDGADVAVKIFKRIQEFKNRGRYVEGDPRYRGQEFAKASAREQLALWTEKEFRNLTRARREGVPVPAPLDHRDNVLFLRFLGEDGWPCPQLRELDPGLSRRAWTAFYEQTLRAVRDLYCRARLVHGDLSEYNVLVCPGRLLGSAAGGGGGGDGDGDGADDDDELRVALIDFGQAVDRRHADAPELLRRDVRRVKEFFDKRGVATVSLEAAVCYCQTPEASLPST